jgi:hypothetical protein
MSREEFDRSNREAYLERVAICLDSGIPYSQAVATARKEFNDRLKYFLETT